MVPRDRAKAAHCGGAFFIKGKITQKMSIFFQTEPPGHGIIKKTAPPVLEER